MPRSFFPEREPLFSGGPLATLRWLETWRRNRLASDVVLSGDETTTIATGSTADIDVGTGDMLRCNNPTLLRIQGLVVGGDRVQRIPIASLGAGDVWLEHEHTSAAAERRILTGTGTILKLAAGKGAALLEYDSITQRFRVISHRQGGPISQVFAAGEYTASAGTWDVTGGDVLRHAFTLVGNRLTIDIDVRTTTTSTTPAELRMTMPGEYTAGASMRQLIGLNDNGTARLGILSVTAGSTVMTITRQDGSNFAMATDTTGVYGVVSVEVQP